MKRISVALLFLISGLARAEWTSSGYTSSNDLSVYVESKFEPPSPRMAGNFGAGLQSLRRGQPGLRRYVYERTSLQYFGYDVAAEPLESTGEYRVTFSSLSLTPEEIKLPNPSAWKMFPPPVFPAPQIVHDGDTIAIDLFENPSTGQKFVDYIRVQRGSRAQSARSDCGSEGSGEAKLTCLSGKLDKANAALASKRTELQTRADASSQESLRRSEESWEKYRDETCQPLSTREKQLQCQLELTRSHVHDLKTY